MAWLPKIISRRLKAERAEDERAVARQRVAWVMSILAAIFGFGSGTLGLYFGLKFNGLVP